MDKWEEFSRRVREGQLKAQKKAYGKMGLRWTKKAIRACAEKHVKSRKKTRRKR